jgi:hypothetical protein
MPAYAKRLQQSSGWVWCFGVGYAVGGTAWAGAPKCLYVPQNIHVKVPRRPFSCAVLACWPRLAKAMRAIDSHPMQGWQS